jgi:hypothetical protein
MHEIAIQQLDYAALTLIQALDKYYDELKPYFEGDQLESLHQDVVNLRRALLGLQMGPLYWETPTEIVEQVVNSETLPIEAAAARVTELLEQRREDEADTA